MAWLWSSWEEFSNYAHPVEVQEGIFKLVLRESAFERERRLFDAVEKLRRSLAQLRDLGYAPEGAPKRGAPQNEPFMAVEEAIRAGEMLLLCHKRLALSKHACGFYDSNDIINHWDRYMKTGRVPREVPQLVKEAEDLLAGFRQVVADDERFLVDDLELPADLAADFREARDLFSVGFDAAGVLVAGRGLEGVLRAIARRRRVVLDAKRPEPAADCDFADLVECMYRLRWRATKARLIPKETKALLDYLRTIRNVSAHPEDGAPRADRSPREVATVMARTADHLWKTAARRHALESTTVSKVW